MAFLRTYSASVREASIAPAKWHSRQASSRRKIASEVLSAYSPDKWLLTHVSIMASVDVEKDSKDPKQNWRIIPEHSFLVNNNGDAWERELLKATYKTFLGANVFVEHVQIVSLAKGKVIDVALREVDLGKRADGTPITTLYVDLLMATSWEHDDLCNKILSGEFNSTSMGCKISYSTCTRCGNTAKDEAELCEHVRFEKRNTYYDREGKPRVVAELCGSSDDPSSVVFIDASWVRNPAFAGAVLRNIISPPQQRPAALVEPMPVPLEALPREAAKKGDSLMENLKGRVTPYTEHHAIPKAASTKAAAGADDERFGLGAPDAAPATDAPAPDAGFPEAPQGDTSDPLAGMDKPVEDAGAPPADGAAPADGSTPPADGVDPAVAAATPLDAVKKDVMDSMLGQIKQELLDSAKKMMGDKGEGTPSSTYMSNSGDDLVKQASAATSKEACHVLWSKYSIDVQMVHNKRLAAALLLAATGGMSRMASFGFDRKDMLSVLSYLDKRAGVEVLSDAAVQFVGMTRNASNTTEFIRNLMITTGREPSVYEAKKALAWANLLKHF